MDENLFDDQTTQIPDKMYFRIGEVSRIVGVPQYVLRYWESEFPAISPRRTGRGHRLYRRQDVQLFLEIKDLLYVKRYTIAGARKALRARGRTSRTAAAESRQIPLFADNCAGLSKLREELMKILELLRD